MTVPSIAPALPYEPPPLPPCWRRACPNRVVDAGQTHYCRTCWERIKDGSRRYLALYPGEGS